MRRTLQTTGAALSIVISSMALALLVPGLAEQFHTAWGDLVTPGFALGLLVAWAACTVALTPRRRRTTR